MLFGKASNLAECHILSLFHFHRNEIGLCSIKGPLGFRRERHVVEKEVVAASLQHSAVQ